MERDVAPSTDFCNIKWSRSMPCVASHVGRIHDGYRASIVSTKGDAFRGWLDHRIKKDIPPRVARQRDKYISTATDLTDRL